LVLSRVNPRVIFFTQNLDNTKIKPINQEINDEDQLLKLKSILVKKGCEIYYKDITSKYFKDIPFKVVKVIIPGMQPVHLNEKYPLFGGNRLKSVPLALGYEIPRNLNSYPHPFLYYEKKKIEDIIESLKLPKSREFKQRYKDRRLLVKYKKTPYRTWPEQWKKVYYKAYPKMEQVLLPAPTKPKWSLDKALIQRESKRDFIKEPIDVETFSNLLFYSGGLKKLVFNSEENKRFYPSAGARYPLEVYPFVFKV